MVEKVYEAVVGEQFLEGETWTSPRRTKYIVKSVGIPWGASPTRFAVLETVLDWRQSSSNYRSRVRKIRRAWDAVEGWVRDPKENGE